MVSFCLLIVDPPVAKLAPCLKFDPSEFRYALKYGNPTRSAIRPNENINQKLKLWKALFCSENLFFTYEINGETTIRVSSGGSVEETLTVRSSDGLESGGDSSSVGVRISEVVNRRKSTRTLNWSSCCHCY